MGEGQFLHGCWVLCTPLHRTMKREDKAEDEGTRILYQGPSLVWLSRGVGSAVLLPASLRALAALAILGPG